MTTPLPILYSFRRCPYAMRARMALHYSGLSVELREILLKNKPAAMLASSPKGTVPVLILSDGTVIDESLDVMEWALAFHDPDDWRRRNHPEQQTEIQGLIAENDGVFKQNLDRYKYADRHPEHPATVYRDQGEGFLQQLNTRLLQTPYLLGEDISIADIALFPFIRQFAHVDKAWFDQTPYRRLQQWLDTFLQSDRFAHVMRKYPLWQIGDPVTIFP